MIVNVYFPYIVENSNFHLVQYLSIEVIELESPISNISITVVKPDVLILDFHKYLGPYLTNYIGTYIPIYIRYLTK